MGLTTTDVTPPDDDPGIKRLRSSLGKFIVAVGVIASLAVVAVIWNGIHGNPASTAAPGADDQPAASTPVVDPGPAPDSGDSLTSTVIPPSSAATTLTGTVPTGYPQTEDGAVAAATNYLTSMFGNTDMLVGTARQAVLDTTLSAAQRQTYGQTLSDTFDAARQRLGLADDGTFPGGGNVILRVGPWAYHLDSYDTTSAVVSIWYESLAGVTGLTTDNPVSVTYATSQITLTWESGDWKWQSETSQDGPSPLGADSSTDFAALADRMENFVPYSYSGTP